MNPPTVLEWACQLTAQEIPRLRSTERPLLILIDDTQMLPWVEPLDAITVLPGASPQSGQLIVGEADGALVLTRAIAPLGDGRWRARQDRREAREQAVWPLAVGIRIHKADGPLVLDQGYWRLAGELVSRLSDSPRAAALLAELTAIGRKIAHPLTPPLMLGPPAELARGVRAKYRGSWEVETYDFMLAEGLDGFESRAAREFKPGGTVLDIGCGAGREAIALARAGFKLVAIDIADEMIERARRNARREGVEAQFHVMGSDDLAFPGESFDGVFFGWEIYGHIPGRSRRIETLRRIRQLLRSDGVLLLFQSWRKYTTWISRARLVDTLRRIGRGILGDRLSEPGDHLLRGLTADGAYLPCAFYHTFCTDQEIRAELEAGGFAVTMSEGGVWVARPR